MNRNSKLQEDSVPVFYPTLEEMKEGFEEYISKIEPEITSAGICKIVPPKEWIPRKSGYGNLRNHVIERPIRQNVTGRKGIYHAVHLEQKNMKLSEFQKMAALPQNNPGQRCAIDEYESVEREFWKNITHAPPLYGADGTGSFFDTQMKVWNVAELDTLLSKRLEESNINIPGVNTAYLYFGMWRSMFAWHTEDMDLYSVNYLHFGASKSWYVIPPKHKERFETLARNLVAEQSRSCPEFLRHKETMISPQLLQASGIPVTRMVQNEREFVINCPGAYHSGFNQGFNCAESTNFATQKWVPVGRKAKACACKPDSVKIDMTIFEEKTASQASEGVVPNANFEGQPSTSESAGGGLAGKWLQGDNCGVCAECGTSRNLPDSLRRQSYRSAGKFHCKMLEDSIGCGSREDSALEAEGNGESSFRVGWLTDRLLSVSDPLWTAKVVNSPGSLKLRIKVKRARETTSAEDKGELQEEAMEPWVRQRVSRKRTKLV